MTLHNLAQCVADDGRPGEAAEYMWQALEIDMAKLEPSDVAITLDKLGRYVREVMGGVGGGGDRRVHIPNSILIDWFHTLDDDKIWSMFAIDKECTAYSVGLQ